MFPQPTPNHAASRGVGVARVRRRGGAFTLIELILVMAILAVVLAVAAPSLGRFFRGRNLDSEAYRLVSLTRHAQTRAATEGIPILLWVDPVTQRYGLQADSTWTALDGRRVEFTSAEDVLIKVQQADPSRTNGTLGVRESSPFNRPTIRFMPDGSFGITSPEWIELQGRLNSGEPNGQLWIAPGLNRQNYEIWTHQPPQFRR